MPTMLLATVVGCADPAPDGADTAVPTSGASMGGQIGNEGPPLMGYPTLALLSGAAFGRGEIAVLRTLEPDPSAPGPVGTVLAAADLDGDGAPELGAELYGAADLSLPVAPTVRWLVFAGPDLAEPLTVELATASIAGRQDPEDPPRAVGDLDGDGVQELAAWTGIDAPQGRRIGLFSGAALLGAGGAEVAPWRVLPPGPTRLPVSLGDLDGDSLPALAVAGPVWLAEVGDVDGDGALDLAVATDDGRLELHSGAGLLDGEGPLSWLTLDGLAPGDAVRPVALGDVDGDGRPDVGFRGQIGAQLQVGWVSGAALAAGGELPPSSGPVPVDTCVSHPVTADLAVDLDSDGVREWVFLGDLLCAVSVPRLVAPETMDGPMFQPFGPPTLALAAVGDLDGDTVPDLAATAYSSW